MGLKHFFHSTKADPADPTIIGATKWNADHYYVDAAGAPIGNVGALLLAGAAGALTHLNSVAAGQVLTSAGAGALPVWAAPTSAGPATNLQVASLGVGVAPGAAGSITTAGDIASNGTVTGTQLVAGVPDFGIWMVGRARLTSLGDGTIMLANNANNNFSLLQFGGTTGAFPALKRSGAALQAVTADNLAFGDFAAGNISANGNLAASLRIIIANVASIQAGTGSPEGVVVASRGAVFLRTDGGATTTLYVKSTDGVATGWVAK